MHNNSNTIVHYKSSLVALPLIFTPVLLYPPLCLTYNVSDSLRIGLFVLLISYLFLATRSISRIDMTIAALFLFLTVSVWYTNYAYMDGLRTAGSTMLTLAFAWSMRRAVNKNERVKNALVKFYTNFFILIPTFSVLSIIYLYIFGELNLFNLDGGEHGTYIFTPFGILLSKDFAGIFEVYRSFSYFLEPVLLAVFYVANIFLVAPHLKSKSRLFLISNVIGGILTFSYLFFVLSFLIIFLNKVRAISMRSGIYILLFAICVQFFLQIDIFASSSLSDRVERMNYFLEAMGASDIYQFMLGHGFVQDTGFDRGFSGGLFTTIYEVGVVNLMAITYFVFILVNKNYQILLLFLAAQLAVEPIKMPLCWVLVVVLAAVMPERYSLLPKGVDFFKRKNIAV